MLDQIINNPSLNRYITTFKAGESLFLEGDDTQDVYFLVSGKVAILKGRKKIAEISDEGSVFGEMSFLLGEKRTATVKATNDIKTIRIPKEELSTFLSEFPEVVKEFAKYLARRLDETSQILYGLKEFCDQLPDAVILTDKDGNILSWNRAAENLYGREENEMRHRSVEEIYEDPEEYRTFLDKVVSGDAIREKTLMIRHPEKGLCHISTSTTALYDGQHNLQGVLSLGRDVTSVEVLERRYQRARRWLIPSLVLLVVLTAGIFFGYPYFSKGYKITDIRKGELRDDLAVNYRLLRSLLIKPFEEGERAETTLALKGFFDVQKGITIPYIGLVLLNKDKKVFDVYSIEPGVDVEEMVGSSYADIDFEGAEDPLYKVLTLYRASKDHPMGYRSTEIAFKLYRDNNFLGWLIFQVDMELLKLKYNVDEKDLRKFHFQESEKKAG